MKQRLITEYTLFGYECFLEEDGKDRQEPFHRGGNAHSCSETIHMPTEVGEPANRDKLKLNEVKVMAKLYHKELLKNNPSWEDGGIWKNLDGQDEMLHMLGYGHMASDTKRLEKKRKASI